MIYTIKSTSNKWTHCNVYDLDEKDQDDGTRMMTKTIVGEEMGHAMFLEANKHLKYQTIESYNGTHT